MKAALAVAVVTLTTSAFAQSAPTSEEYAMMATKTYSAWSCATFAEYMDKNAEAERMRLFKLGYETGKSAIEALIAGKIKKEDWNKHAPWSFGMMLSGPNIDFALGRIFEWVAGDTVEAVFKDTRDDEGRKTQASNMDTSKNPIRLELGSSDFKGLTRTKTSGQEVFRGVHMYRQRNCTFLR